MREIKFRAWQKAHKKMHYKVNLYSMNCHEMNRAQLDNKSFMDTIGLSCQVMQFTGLIDKNGKEIYEGDIVKYAYKRDTTTTAEFTEVIEYDIHPDGIGFRVITHFSPEVIGNIYENPELKP